MFALGLLAGFILCFLLLARPLAAQAPTTENEDYVSEDIIIENNALQIRHNSQLREVTGAPVRRENTKSVAGGHNQVPTGGRHYSKEEVQELIRQYSEQYGISPTLPLRIAKCESGYNQFSKNKFSTASGVFQYLKGTWANTDEGKAGYSVFDADANVRAAIKYIASRGHAKPWEASRRCWNA